MNAVVNCKQPTWKVFLAVATCYFVSRTCLLVNEDLRVLP